MKDRANQSLTGKPLVTFGDLNNSEDGLPTFVRSSSGVRSSVRNKIANFEYLLDKDKNAKLSEVRETSECISGDANIINPTHVNIQRMTNLSQVMRPEIRDNERKVPQGMIQFKVHENGMCLPQGVVQSGMKENKNFAHGIAQSGIQKNGRETGPLKSEGKEVATTVEHSNEEFYVSRKLLMRQLIEHEITKSKANGNHSYDSESDQSVADSWAEIEDNFTRIYEPVPFDINMKSWRKMTKSQILEKVSSKRLVEELSPLNRAEILKRIENLRESVFISPENSFLYASVAGKAYEGNRKAERINDYAEISDNTNSSDEEVLRNNAFRTESSRNVQNLNPRNKNFDVNDDNSDSLSWKSIPAGDGDDDLIYISRSEILSRYESQPNDDYSRCENDGPPRHIFRHLMYPSVSRKAIIENATSECGDSWNKAFNSQLKGKPTSYFSRSEIVAELLDNKENRPDDINTKPTTTQNVIEGSPGNDKYDRAEFAKVYEAFTKLEKVSKNGRVSDFDLINKEFNEMGKSMKPNKSNSTRKIQMSRNVSDVTSPSPNVTSFPNTENSKQNFRLKKTKTVYNSEGQSSSNLNGSQDMECPESKEEYGDVLSEDLEYEGNVNLGFIYVPMDTRHAPLITNYFKEPSDNDTFESIDSLMFEPKCISSQFKKFDSNTSKFISTPGPDEQSSYCIPLAKNITTDSKFMKEKNVFFRAPQENVKYMPVMMRRVKSQDKNKNNLKNSNIYPYVCDYHPDISNNLSNSNDNSIITETSDSDLDSITSVESVIPNNKYKSENGAEDEKKKKSQKYVVNHVEWDSNSETEKMDSIVNPSLLDSDTSWDYVDSNRHIGNGNVGNNVFYKGFQNIEGTWNIDNNMPVNYVNQVGLLVDKNHPNENLHNNSHLMLKNSKVLETERCKDENLYEECGNAKKESAANEKSIIKPEQDRKNDSLPENKPSTVSKPENEINMPTHLPIHGFFHVPYENIRCPLLSNVKSSEVKEISESCPKSHDSGINLLSDDSLLDSLEPSHLIDKALDNQSVSTVTTSVGTYDKIKKVQKLGISLMSFKDNDRMMKELKLKLKSKFSPGTDFIEDSLECLDNQKCLEVQVQPKIVESKRKQLEPQISKIMRSIHDRRKSFEDTVKNSNFTENNFKRETSTLNESVHSKDSDLLKVEKEVEVCLKKLNDSIFWIPTPDYTPLSTLHRDDGDFFSDDSLVPLYVASKAETYFNIENFVNARLNVGQEGIKAFTEDKNILVNKSNSPKRSVRFDTSVDVLETPIKPTWSDLESLIFAENCSFGSSSIECSYRPSSALVDTTAFQNLPETRMESYNDDWLLWDQFSKMKRSRSLEDKERWESEKTKRMLLWIHHSHNDYDSDWFFQSAWWRAKQRASISWIVQKAHKNKVPSDMEEPFYKDYEGLERLKPGIVHRMSNADLYCSAMANIYGDPNFHNLSHWNIIQALARKGVYVAEPTDVALTETVLIQTTPIKISAHLAVIEAMMSLYIREVVIAERVVQAIQRISGVSQSQEVPTPQDHEDALVLWVDSITQALQARLQAQVRPPEGQELPVFPKIQDLSDLSDGIGLAALVAYYCSNELTWEDIAVADPPSMADSLYNVGLVIKFCHESLPYNPCLLSKEDIVYMHSSVKQNILAFVAELFFLMELEPVSCVTSSKRSSKYIQLSSPGSSSRCSHYSGWSGSQRSERAAVERRHSMSPTSVHSAYSLHSTAGSSFSAPSSHSHYPRSSCSASVRGMKAAGVPSTPNVRRSHSMNLNDVQDSKYRGESRSDNAPSSQNSDYGGRDSSMSDGQDSEFMVQRAKGYATLSDMMRAQSSPRPSHVSSQDYRYTPKEKYNVESKEEELGERRLSRRGSLYGSTQELSDVPPAGIPSRLEKRPMGRSRSRRNSITVEDSQLTIENFGGSQDNLNYISRNPDKEVYTHTGKRESVEPTPARRSLSQSRERDFERTHWDELDNRVVDKLEREAFEQEKIDRRYSNEHFKENWRSRKDYSGDTSSESDGSNEADKRSNKATSFAELSKIKEQLPGGINIIYMQSDRDDSKTQGKEKKTSFAALPNQTTWKQQSVQSHGEDNSDLNDEMEPQIVSSELYNVKLKLEEKRRRIESEKRKMELMANKQRQKLGKEAFMQAVVKGKLASSTGSSTPTTASEAELTEILTDSLNHRSGTNLSPTQPNASSPSQTKLPSFDSCNTRSFNPSSVVTNPPPNRPRSILTLKDVGNDVSSVSKKWLYEREPVEDLKTPDIETMDPEEYQRSLTQMTDSLTEIQTDIHRLSQQQQQIQSMMHNGSSGQPQHHSPSMHPQQQNQFYLHEQQGSPSRRMWNQQIPGPDGYNSMSPASRRAQWGPVRPMMPQGEYMMGGHPQQSGYYSYQMMQPPMQLPHMNQVGPTMPQSQPPGFMLHGQTQSMPPGHQQNMYQNGQNYYSPEQYRGYPNSPYDRSQAPPSHSGNAPFRLHNETEESPRNSSLQSNVPSPNRQSQVPPPPRSQKSPSPSRQVSHAPVSAPPPDDMEPQNVSFIESDENEKFKRMSISSGSRTYRVLREPGSPTRPALGSIGSGTKTYRVPTKKGTPVYDGVELPEPSPPPRSRSPTKSYSDGSVKVEPLFDGPKRDQGFYISLDDETGPKRPKPPLRTKKMLQKKNSAPSTPQSTPTSEDGPPLPISGRHSMRNLNDLQDNTPYQSLKASREDKTPFKSISSPIYSTPQVPYQSPNSSFDSPSSYWTPNNKLNDDNDKENNNRRFNNNTNNRYYDNYDSDGGSDSESDFACDDNRGSSKPKRNSSGSSTAGMAMVIGDDSNNQNSALSEMEKKKERLMMMSMKRKQQQEEMKRKKEIEAEMKREEEKMKEDMKLRKKEEEKARRELILEKHKIKKAIEDAEKDGRHYTPPSWYHEDSGSNTPSNRTSSVKTRNRSAGGSKPRPRTMHEASFASSHDNLSASGKAGSSHNLAAGSRSTAPPRNNRWGSSGSLNRATGSRGSTGSIGPDSHSNTVSRTIGRHSGRRPMSVVEDGNNSVLRRARSKGSIYGSRPRLDDKDSYRVHESRRPSLASTNRYRPSVYDNTKKSPRKYRSTGNLYGNSEHDSLMYHMSEDSGLGRATPPRRAPSPGMSSRHLTSPNGPGSLPPGLFARRRPGLFDDNMSDISTASSNMDYCGPRLFKQPTAKSNRNIILNAVEYCVFPGVVNQNAKQRVLEEIARAEAKYFLILFRDSGCQFRALYSFNPDIDEVYKLYGTGPKQVTERMFEKFFKYNSGGKCFSQIHTKSLTVTIDAFTIHNSLWQGKRVNLPSKKDMKLVI